MAREATGNIERKKDGTPIYVRVKLLDGTSKRIGLAKGCSETYAQEKKLYYAELARTGQLVADPSKQKPGKVIPLTRGGESTVHGWQEAWFADRERRGIRGLRQEKSRYDVHLRPTFGKFTLSKVTREQLEDFVSALDARVRAEEISWKTAEHAWTLLAKMFVDACESKTRTLRVREDNPAARVSGPDKGAAKQKQFLYPSEFQDLMACARVPVRWRRLVALAIYLYPRPGEHEALRWEDVDLAHGVVNIHHATSDEGEDLSTKTDGARPVPIEPTLLPLLEAMKKESGGKGLVCVMPPESELSKRLRVYLTWAGVKRAALHVGAKHRTLKQMTWYDLRATGITWRAVRGDNPIKVHVAAGHADIKTTMGYVRAASAMGDHFGDVFPVLHILESANTICHEGGEDDFGSLKTGTDVRPQRDSNPR